MRVAYADPPYPGQAKRHYADHPDYGGEVDHARLIEGLERDYPDGWALSTSVPALPSVLALCPAGEPSKKRAWGGSVKLGTGVRVCVWQRTGIPFPPSRVMWSWEPVIVRTPHWRQRHKHDFVPDLLYATQPRGFLGNEITGQKPVAFCRWIFDLLGLGPNDELVDVFPGSGAVGKAFEDWKLQTTIYQEMAAIAAIAAAFNRIRELQAQVESLRDALRVVELDAVFLTYDPRNTDAQNDALQRRYMRVLTALGKAGEVLSHAGVTEEEFGAAVGPS